MGLVVRRPDMIAGEFVLILATLQDESAASEVCPPRGRASAEDRFQQGIAKRRPAPSTDENAAGGRNQAPVDGAGLAWVGHIAEGADAPA